MGARRAAAPLAAMFADGTAPGAAVQSLWRSARSAGCEAVRDPGRARARSRAPGRRRARGGCGARGASSSPPTKTRPLHEPPSGPAGSARPGPETFPRGVCILPVAGLPAGSALWQRFTDLGPLYKLAKKHRCGCHSLAVRVVWEQAARQVSSCSGFALSSGASLCVSHLPVPCEEHTAWI